MGTTFIGARIANARKDKNISQAQLAEHMFVSPQAVGKWERGESIPDILTFNRLAEVLGVDLNYFSENFPSMATGTPPAETGATPPPEQPSADSGDRPRWDMSQGNWANVDFSGLKNLHEKLGSSNMQYCTFIGSDLSGLLLKRNNVDTCDFSGSDFGNSHIQSSNIHKDIFRDCSLKGARFTSSNVYACDFTGADLTGVVFTSSGFEKNIFSHTILSRTSFTEMQLVDIVFNGTVQDCSFENCVFTRIAFQNATIVNTFFKNINLKKVQFVDCRVDRITYAFLKNGKADMSGITLVTEDVA